MMVVNDESQLPIALQNFLALNSLSAIRMSTAKAVGLNIYRLGPRQQSSYYWVCSISTAYPTEVAIRLIQRELDAHK